MKKIIFIVAILLMSLTGYSQELFKVLASSGNNKVQTTESSEWKLLFFGKKLMSGDKIIISDKGYLGLVFKNGKSIELKKSGTYKVSDLAKDVDKQNASVNSKYVEFLAGEMNKAATDNMARNRYKYMSVTGSVVRGENEIMIFADSSKSVNVLGTKMLLKWEKEVNTITYQVIVYNLFGDVLLIQETKETSIILNLDSKKEKMYIATVYSKENTGIKNDLRISYFSADRSMELNKQLEDLKTNLAEETALNKLILASFYEDNKLYPEAMQSYETAIKLEPSVEDYLIAYNQFLERVKIAKPVK